MLFKTKKTSQFIMQYNFVTLQILLLCKVNESKSYVFMKHDDACSIEIYDSHV